ncbi:transmembrane protein, putative [Medicago truncatula]|uniref:Transmembrane protein, putative n=1 Tax=Medicago truncatula TaxID=3880 RepID=A0A072UVL9_MEDTR|nr:transmembrane protein, putative [Medicago truncatula]
MDLEDAASFHKNQIFFQIGSPYLKILHELGFVILMLGKLGIKFRSWGYERFTLGGRDTLRKVVVMEEINDVGGGGREGIRRKGYNSRFAFA